MFVRNGSSHLKEENFPMLMDLLSKTSYTYLPQQHLGVDPIEFNLNAEVWEFLFSIIKTEIERFASLLEQVITLVGPPSQQDVEMSALYRDAVITYGDGKVLGILATKTSDHELRKRAAPEETTQENQATTPTPGEPSKQTDFIYYPGDQSANKILLYTDTPPRLFDGTNITVLNDTAVVVTTDQKGEQRILNVRYNYKNKVCSAISS